MIWKHVYLPCSATKAVIQEREAKAVDDGKALKWLDIDLCVHV